MTIGNPPEVETEPTPPEPAPSGLRRIIGVIVALAAVTAVVLFGAPFLARLVGGSGATATTVVPPGQEVAFVVAPGSSAAAIGSRLERVGVVSADEFAAAVADANAAEALQAGEYQLETGMSGPDVVTVLREGPDVGPTTRVTIPEGLRIVEILDLLAEELEMPRDDLERALLTGEVSTSLAPGDTPTTIEGWEGLLFPATYEIPDDADPAAALQMLSDTAADRVAEVDWSALEAAGLSRYEGLVIASLVEAEARVDGDRRRISSVIRNRLDEGMRLDIDATVLYAVGKRGGLTSADLEVDSPYNTRVVAGLPPTPIATPGSASLAAAARPANTDFLYYVVTNKRGRHTFTDDYDEFLSLKAQAQEDGLIP
ncbi:MAG TPA: endolytic transglycosylase MltG [Acidimicrobiia bacterium]|jgi:UPF0755 protein|nr:endolytic transglycosylase MltG [Acidimicrobiia bacterium]